MKLYEVVYEEDGRTITAPGISETQVKRARLYYAAESAEAVWEAIADLRSDPERTFMGLGEIAPLVTVITGVDSTGGSS